MPLSKMKKIWSYCTYNKPFFLLVFILFFVLEYFMDTYSNFNTNKAFLIVMLINIILCGYGMTISRDRMNNGIRLPKIMIKDIIVLGIKSYIVFTVYLLVQGYVLDLICSPLNFPEFDLEDMLLKLPETLHTLYSQNPVDALAFIIIGSILFYITSFFMEIALARLADTNNFKTAFNLLKIKSDIDLIGWRSYTKEFTAIIVAIVLFGAFKYIVIPVEILNYIWNVFLDLLLISAQFLGIGAIYSRIKEKKSNFDLSKSQ